VFALPPHKLYVKLTVRDPLVGEPDKTKVGVPVQRNCEVVEVQLTTVAPLAVVVTVPLVPNASVFKDVPLIETVVQVQL